MLFSSLNIGTLEHNIYCFEHKNVWFILHTQLFLFHSPIFSLSGPLQFGEMLLQYKLDLRYRRQLVLTEQASLAQHGD
jgi:hypothetical protein